MRVIRSLFGFGDFWGACIGLLLGVGIGICSCVGGCVVFCESVAAAIYRCDKEDGSVEFRDRPCRTSDDMQSPIVVKPNVLPGLNSVERMSFSNTPETESISTRKRDKEGKEPKKKSKKLALKREAEKRKQKRLRLSAEKKREKELQKEERRKLRCEKWDEKLRAIENEQRAGCRLKKFNALQDKKKHILEMKRKHCSNLKKAC